MSVCLCVYLCIGFTLVVCIMRSYVCMKKLISVCVCVCVCDIGITILMIVRVTNTTLMDSEPPARPSLTTCTLALVSIVHYNHQSHARLLYEQASMCILTLLYALLTLD